MCYSTSASFFRVCGWPHCRPDSFAFALPSFTHPKRMGRETTVSSLCLYPPILVHPYTDFWCYFHVYSCCFHMHIWLFSHVQMAVFTFVRCFDVLARCFDFLARCFLTYFDVHKSVYGCTKTSIYGWVQGLFSRSGESGRH